MCKYEPKRKSACNEARANDYNNLCSGRQFENWELFSPKFFYSSGVCYRPVLSPSSSLEWEDRKYRPPEEDQQVFLIHLYTIWNQFRIESHCAAFCCTILSFPLSIICTYRPPEEDQQVFLIHLYTIWNQFRIASHCAAFCCTCLSLSLSYAHISLPPTGNGAKQNELAGFIIEYYITDCNIGWSRITHFMLISNTHQAFQPFG